MSDRSLTKIAEISTIIGVIIAAITLIYTMPPSQNSNKGENEENNNYSAKKENPFNEIMVKVEGGTFLMGNEEYPSAGAIPVHSVSLKSYFISATEVTQKQWREVMGSNPSYFEGDNLPVENVSWNDIQQFLRKLNSKHIGKNYRLPTEAEWEFAARGGNKSKGYLYSGSNNPSIIAWCGGVSDGKTHPVGQKLANEIGLYDMSGNVEEWCNDLYKHYDGTFGQNSKGIMDDTRVIRGGYYNNAAWAIFVFCRNAREPNHHKGYLGFRICCDY